MDHTLKFRWLGVAGLSLELDGFILSLDPFFTRPSYPTLFFGRPLSKAALAEEKLPRADAILISHPHYDHLMDIPPIAIHSKAQVYTSPHGCRLLEALGVPGEQVHCIQAGDSLTLGPFRVTVLSADHIHLPIYTAGTLPASLQPPLRLIEYVLDECFSFLVEWNDVRLLVWHSSQVAQAEPADILCVMPHEPPAFYRQLFPLVQPKTVIPFHWDDFFQPLSRPLRPLAPTWAARLLGRTSLTDLKRLTTEILPKSQFFQPEIFHEQIL